MSHLATQENIFFFSSKSTLPIYAQVIFLDHEEGKNWLPVKLYVLFTCQGKGLTKSRTLITAVQLFTLTDDGLPNCIAVIWFPIVLQQTNIKVLKLPIFGISGLCTKAVLSAFHSLRGIKSVWHSLPVCCHAAPHLALQQAPDCSWAGHREVINGLPHFKQQLENIGGTM